MPDILKYSKKIYLTILQTAVWLLSIITPFIIPPPVLLPDHAELWVHLTQFFVAAFIGLMLFPMTRFGKRKYVANWWTISIAIFICSLIISASYLIIYMKSTALVQTDDNTVSRLVIGKTLTSAGTREKASIFRELGREATNEELINSFPPNDSRELSKVWVKDSIENNIQLLSVLHLSTLLMLSLLVLSIVQVLKCLNIKDDEN